MERTADDGDDASGDTSGDTGDGPAPFLTRFTPTSSPDLYVCPRYEIMYEYLRLQNFAPLTSLQQRAFLFMLDLESGAECDGGGRGNDDGDDATPPPLIHSHEEGCICLEILPAIVQALDPDPVDCIVSERSLEDETYKSARFHTEKIGKYQGIVLSTRTKKEHTDELNKLGRRLIGDFDVIFQELRTRLAITGHRSEKALLEAEFPKILEFISVAVRKGRGARKIIPMTTPVSVVAPPAPAQASTAISTSTAHAIHQHQTKERYVNQILDEMRRKLNEKFEADQAKLAQAAALIGEVGVVVDGLDLGDGNKAVPASTEIAIKATPSIPSPSKKPPATKQPPPPKPPKQSVPREGTVRDRVLVAISNGWIGVEGIAAKTKLKAIKIRGVLNAGDLRDRIDKREGNGAGKLLEYRLKVVAAGATTEHGGAADSAPPVVS